MKTKYFNIVFSDTLVLSVALFFRCILRSLFKVDNENIASHIILQSVVNLRLDEKKIIDVITLIFRLMTGELCFNAISIKKLYKDIMNIKH